MATSVGNLVVPIVLWGRNPPTHCISAIYMTSDLSTIVTGSNDGQLVIWDVKPNWQIQCKMMLFGHTASISCLTKGSNSIEQPYVISASDNGELCLWDIRDGRCLENSTGNLIHTNIHTHQFRGMRNLQLICNGFYPEIHILNASSFEPLFALCSKVAPDWISACCVINPINCEEDVVMAISNSGAVKVWFISEAETKNRMMYEHESKQIRCLNAQTFTSCRYNQRTILVVCTKYWQIYDASDFTLLCSESNRCGERWVGGEFISLDRVIVWSNEGKGYLYKLPTSAVPDSTDYRTQNSPSAPLAYQVLDSYAKQPFSCTPAMGYKLSTQNATTKILLRGDCEGNLAAWVIPDIQDKKLRLMRQESFDRLPVMNATSTSSINDSWPKDDLPRGILDDICYVDGEYVEITATIYIPSQGKLCCGGEDGSIVIVPATLCVVYQLLDKQSLHTSDIPIRTLSGHNGKVTCLLYPFTESTRYEPQHLVSGGIDFSVCLWDVYTGTKLFTFCVHAGEVTQLLVPPANCNVRFLSCVCSVANDHSVALVSLKEKKCLLLAGRHLFPVKTIRWRPIDDFLIVGCTDGTIYVWQMETGHLDRVVHGITAEEILNNCNENAAPVENLINPTISLSQALKRRNLATFRNLAQQKMQASAGIHPSHAEMKIDPLKPQSYPLYIQGLRTNIKNSDCHILLFDMEALIVQLVADEYTLMTPVEVERRGSITIADRAQKNIHSEMRQSQVKIAEMISTVKDRSETSDSSQQLEDIGFVPIQPAEQTKTRSPTHPTVPWKPRPTNLDMSGFDLIMETAQILLSCLMAWGLDGDLEKLCISKLGLIMPRGPISFGLVSRQGFMALLLPSWQKLLYGHRELAETPELSPMTSLSSQKSDDWSLGMRSHWSISNAISTQHLLSVISVANTLMTLNHATFVETWRMEKMHKKGAPGVPIQQDSSSMHQAQVKQGWSLLAALHCVLLPELIGPRDYQSPLLELLAHRWQDRCLEIREAAQALFLAELRRIGADGRKAIVDSWSPYLPTYVDASLSLMGERMDHDDEDGTAVDDDDSSSLTGDFPGQQSSISMESRRRQATAIIMLGVIGAEFGQEIQPSRCKADDDQKKKTVQEGFSISSYSLARHTSKALTFLLLQPPSKRLPAFTPIRRAGIDLLGRGFTVWEPYLDVSAVLIRLLELCASAEKLVPNQTYGLPLKPESDACRTARHALSLIATARPPAFIITMAKEVARYNALAINTQTPPHVLVNNPLVKGRGEILRVIELLVDKMPNDVVDLMVETMDVATHCLDAQFLRSKGLPEVFPSICKFSVVSTCIQTRRICVGAKNGGIAFYEPKQHSKCQMLQAHQGVVVAVSFSPDGRYVASYSNTDNRLKFWQTSSSSLFSIGQQQTKCVKNVPTTPFVPSPHTNVLKLARLVWIDARTVILLTVDGNESKYSI